MSESIYRFAENDLIIANLPSSEITVFSGFARVLDVDRENDVFHFDFYTKYGEVAWKERHAQDLKLSDFEEQEYYRLQTREETKTFMNGLRKALALGKYNKITPETLRYVEKTLYPQITATNIQFDYDDEDLAQLIVDAGLSSEAIGQDIEQAINEAIAYASDPDIEDEEDEECDFTEIELDLVTDAIHHNRVPQTVLDEFRLCESVPVPVELFEDCSCEESNAEYIEAVSDYISEWAGFLHTGFSIQCSMSVVEMYERLADITGELSARYVQKNPEWVSDLQYEKELLRKAIMIVECEERIKPVSQEK